MVGETEELEVLEGDGFVLAPETRPALATVREPVTDEYGYVTHYEVLTVPVAVHTIQQGKGGWVCETEDGTVIVVPYENVRFVDGEED